MRADRPEEMMKRDRWFESRSLQAGLIGAVSLFKFRRIKHLIVAAITELVVRRALPFNERI